MRMPMLMERIEADAGCSMRIPHSTSASMVYFRIRIRLSFSMS